ncbi:hypothetical protein PQC18_gp64 [Streptomyces phage Pablito]|uniref:Uncharacterized protein n=1 Tax=Streptomyces phage Pablito TaxID=2894593 RepID=A0AAE9C6Y3_9CAUD|nr:hypothetical protein PQC18_gp64 [Streptomyces phage Pablito]UFD98002.1 hypothetical protein [Streptomyces phage Pablito]
MSREDTGWEYVNGRARWAPTAEGALNNILVGIYGPEYDEKRIELEDLIRAAQRDAVEKLKEAGHDEAAELIFPDYPLEDDE